MTPRAKPRLVVGVGASAGGLEAFKQLLAALPADTGMAFLLVQHLDPTHKSLLTELLAPCTRMRVTDADQDVRLRANTVYIIRPDTALAVRAGKIELTPPTLHRGVRLPVDHLFRSLALEYGPRSVGVVLSGAGSDGSAGLRDIKASGGLTIAEDPDSCGQPGMPQSAIDAGVVDLVLPIAEVPTSLERFASLPAQARLEASNEDESDDTLERLTRLDTTQLARLASLIEAQLDFDVRVYKPSTVERRVLRRMGLAGFDDFESYVEELRRNTTEKQAIVRDLLISVTDFFRDPEAFRALREMILDPLVARVSPGTTLRAWVPGCATGEEAYSLGMEFLDAMDAQGKRLGLQIFATDIDHDALAFARAAIYPPSIADQMSSQRLRTYFRSAKGGGYVVRPPLRDVISFAPHDLTKDPPFSRMHLVSCRNVLIYLTSAIQQRVLKVLHFALEPGGHLFLSTSESTSSQRDLFTTMSKTHRIYKKVGTSRPIALARSRTRPRDDEEADRLAPMTGAASSRSTMAQSHDLARRTVLTAWVPPTIIVSGDDSIVFMHGELGRYLAFPQGDDPRLDLSSVLRAELATRTRAALYKCRRNQEPIVALTSPDTETAGRARITAKPAFELGDGAVMLTFETVEPSTDAPVLPTERPADEAVIAQLESELQATREDLRSTVEELETSNEELRSSNEESMSMNEELQSANEELEATTEELRSLNEELTTVNAQLREKVEQLEQAHDDLHNFFASTKIATIFLDDNLRIKRFTPSARELLGVEGTAVGRLVGDVGGELLRHGLEQEARHVLEHLSTSACELRVADGRWLSRQVLPYRTENRSIEGVVVTFVDITAAKVAAERLAIRERQQAVVARTGLNALKETDLDDFLHAVVRDVEQTLGADYAKILELQPGGDRLLLRAGVGWRDGLTGTAYVDAGRDSQAGYTLRSSAPVIVDDLATEQRFEGPALLVEHEVTSGLSCIIRAGDHPYGVLGAHTKDRRTFTQEDADFLQAVALVVGSAIARYQTRRSLALERSVAQVLADASGLDETLTELMEVITDELGGSVGELWWTTDDGTTLRCRDRHVVPARDADHVARTFARPAFAPGEGLIGQVFANRAAAWATNLGDPALFVRREGANALGLVSGVAIPLCSGTDAYGVVAAFSRERLLGGDVFLRSLDGLGRLIGDFVTRDRAEHDSQRLAAITQSSHDAIICYEADGTVIDWLSGAEGLFGYSAAEMVGQSVERIVPADLRAAFRASTQQTLGGERVEPIDTTRRHKDGTLIEVSVRSSVVTDRRGRPIAVASTERDIRRQKETQERLIEANRQKDDFLAMLGHELRNPLAAIRSATDLLTLLGDEHDTRLDAPRAVLDRQTTHMARLLDGLLDLSRVARGQIALEREVVNVGQVCQEVVSDVKGRIGDRVLDVRTDIPSGEIHVEADRIRIAQIVDNLLSNAVKYTKDGGTILVSLRAEAGSAILRVADDGVGIEPELRPRIFEAFQQSKQTFDRAEGGLGIGLALVKSLAELHGGTVEAHSEGKERGAEFVVRLPTTAALPADEPAPTTRPSRRLHLLLVEDNREAARMMKHVFELIGHQVTLASRGRKGVELAQKTRPDLVLCDLGLPGGMSGFDVAQALKGHSNTRHLRLIALSGYGRPEDKDRSKAAGFDHHLTKPVDVETLEQVIAELDLGHDPVETTEEG